MVYEHHWFQYRTISSKPDEYLDELPSELHSTIKLHMYSHLIDRAPIFRGCQAEFKEKIVLLVRSAAYMKGDCIFKTGDVGELMYFIHHGSVEIWAGPVRLSVMFEGSFFGEIACFSVDQIRSVDMYIDLWTDLCADHVDSVCRHKCVHAHRHVHRQVCC